MVVRAQRGSLDPLHVVSPPPANNDQAISIANALVPVLREAIVSGKLSAGTRLSEAQLARQFKTSRTPVREVLEQLNYEQLVVVVPHVGTCVRAITARDVEEIYQIRVALETLAVSLIIQRLSKIGRVRITESLDELKASAVVGDHERFATARDAFHLLLVHLSGNARLEEIYRSLIGPIRRLRRVVRSDNLTLMHRNVEIAESILARDPAAPDRIQDHLTRASGEVIAALNKEQ